MAFENFNSAIFINYNKDSDGNIIPQKLENSEWITVQATSVGMLSQIPMSRYRVLLQKRDGTNLTEVFNDELIGEDNFKVAYDTSSLVFFHPSQIGKEFKVVLYYGLGCQYISGDRVISGLNSNGRPVVQSDIIAVVEDYNNRIKPEFEGLKDDYQLNVKDNFQITVKDDYTKLKGNYQTDIVDNYNEEVIQDYQVTLKQDYNNLKQNYQTDVVDKYHTEVKQDYQATVKDAYIVDVVDKYNEEVKQDYKTTVKDAYQTDVVNKYNTELKQDYKTTVKDAYIVDVKNPWLDELKPELERAIENYHVSNNPNWITQAHWTKTIAKDNTATFQIDLSSFNPVGDQINKFAYQSSGQEGAIDLIEGEHWTRKGATITLLRGLVFNTGDKVFVNVYRGIAVTPIAGTNGGDLQNESVSESKLSQDVQDRLNTVYYENTLNFVATANGTTQFTIADSTFNPVTDKLKIYQDNMLIRKDDNYTLNGMVVTLAEALNIGDKIYYEIGKNAVSSIAKYMGDGSLIKEESISKKKLTKDLQDELTKVPLISSQLAEKALQTDLVNMSGKVKVLEQKKTGITDLTDELLQSIAGTATINAVPANGSLVKEKFAKKAIQAHITDFIVIGKNLFNKNTITKGYWVNPTTGNVEVANGYVVSDYIPIEPNTVYNRKKGTWANTYSHYYFDAQFNKISGVILDVKTFTTPLNASYVRLNIADTLETQEQLEKGNIETEYETYGNTFSFPLIDQLTNIDAYPFQSNATFTNTTGKSEIKKAVKKIEVIGANFTKKYCLGIIQRNFSSYGTGAYIYECDIVTGATTKIVATTSKTSYTEPSGIDTFNLAEYQNSGITGKIYIDWTQITSGSQYVNTHYDKAGLDIRTYVDKKSTDAVKINLPSKLYCVIGDTLEIFYKGIIQAVNPFNYNIKIICSKGNAYSKRYIYTPKIGDSNFTMTINVYNNNNELMDSKIITIIVNNIKANPSSLKTVLNIGDSLTGNGEWVGELKRRLTSTGGMPIANNLTNLKFIGTCLKSGANFEGYGGWTWQSFNSNTIPPKYLVLVTSGMKTDTLSEQSVWSDSLNNKWQLETRDTVNSKLKFKQYPSGGSYSMPSSGTLTFVSGGGDNSNIVYSSTQTEVSNPFWIDGKLDFKEYATSIAETSIDYCNILLGWNNRYNSIDSIKLEVKKLIDQLHLDFPNCKVNLLGIEVPSIDGLGANYGADTNWNYYELLQYVFNLNNAYEQISLEASYSTWVTFFNVSSQVDVENNMMQGTRTVNVRNTKTETYGTNGVHLANEGYMQIADVAYRGMMNII